jgi:hypothetical protein
MSLGFVTLRVLLNGGLGDERSASTAQDPPVHIETPPGWTSAIVYRGDETGTANAGFTALVQCQDLELLNCYYDELTNKESSAAVVKHFAFHSATTR